MPERGRPAASSGNAYHDVRVASCLIDLLEDISVTSVAVETLDAIDDLVVQRSGGRVRYEQVKERAPNGSWTAQRLSDEGVLKQFVRQHRIDPNGELVLFTASNASDFREVVERARNASGNHPSDELGRPAALAEWKQRLQGRRSFVDQILSRIATEDCQHTITWQDLLEVLACVQVLDAQGTIDQLRERSVQRLRLLVDDPVRALETFERLARDAAINRSVIRRYEVETALTQDGSGPRLAAFALAIDADAYAEEIQRESAAVDIAKLTSLVPHFDSRSGLSFDLDTVSGKTLLVGGHGAGKSRIAADLAVKSIQSRRQCLHIRLARWATTLRDLLVAELSRAAARHARTVDVDNLFNEAGVLVLDGLDEVPTAQRLTAEREILQFADSYPHVDILVTCRPGSGRTLSQYWPSIELRPLSREQIETAIGRNLHTLDPAEPILALAENPLMLGLLVKRLASGERPSSEAELLDVFIAEIIERESRRIPSIDCISGHRLAEDAAFEWLSSGRIALDQDQSRSMAASVALNLRHTALVQTDATEVERWLIETGLCVKLGAVVVPMHRAVLDHLAGRSMVRRDAIRSAGIPELREAVARYLGSQTEVSEPMLSLLSAVGTDLELLARGRRLTSANIIWPFDPTRFATEYLAELRRLGSGPLIDVGVVGRAIEIDVDREMTWITERDRVGSGDVVKIVSVPDRVYMSGPDGSNRTPVRAFRSAGYRGADIEIRVPHFAAFARAGDELQTLLRQRALPNEGPDIVYERLCSLTERFIQTVTRFGTNEYEGYSDADFCRLTASELQAQFQSYVASITGTEAAQADTFIAFDPKIRGVVVSTGPEAIVQSPGSQIGVHSATLARLVTKATRLEIQELPLHPLALLPNFTTDPILSLPGRRHLLHGDLLGLYIERHELGEIRAFDPKIRGVVVSTGPEAIVQSPGSQIGVHSATLARLVTKATRLEIQELPLHPLALLPNFTTDPILSLPGRRHLLHGDLLGLYIERHELGEIRAFRYLVEHNLRGLGSLLRTYATLPWHIDVTIADLSTSTRFAVEIRSSTRRSAASDEVAVVSEIPAHDALWTTSSSIHAYRGVLNGAYDLVEGDVKNLLNGTNPLGSDVL